MPDKNKKGKPRVHDDQGVKESHDSEDVNRQDKRPAPLGPTVGKLDEALADGTIEPDPNTTPQTPRE